jgi:hypothetical protein
MQKSGMYQKCVATTKAGRQCWHMATTMAGGLAVCDWHVGYAMRLWRHMQESAQTDPLAAQCVEAARRDTIAQGGVI